VKGLAFIIREAIFLASLKFFFNYLNKNKIASKEARDGTILDVVRKIIDKKINLLYYICMHIHIFLKVAYEKNK